MTQGLIFFGGELVGKKSSKRHLQQLLLPDVQAQQAQLPPSSARERRPLNDRRATAPEPWCQTADRMTLIELPHVASHSSSAPFSSRVRRGPGNRQMAATTQGFRSRAVSQDVQDLHATSSEGHVTATSSTAWARSMKQTARLDGTARESPSLSRTTSARLLARPGTEERRSGYIAVLDHSELPRLHSAILKDDVQHASAWIDEAVWQAAEHRSKCYAEAKDHGRKKAAFWKKRKIKEYRKMQDIARKQEERLQQQLEDEAAAQAKIEADGRWKKAFARIQTKETKRVALCGVTHDSLGLAALGHAFVEAAHRPDEDSEGKGSQSDENSDDDNDDANLSAKKIFSWRQKKEPLDKHIKYLRKIQRLRNRSTRFAQQYEIRKARFQRLPEQERKICEAAYLQFGIDPYIRTLNVPGVRDCLYEVGARGISLEEQLAVVKVCSQAQKNAAKTAKVMHPEEVAFCKGGKTGEDPFSDLKHEVRVACMLGGINLYNFATGVLPQARKQLEHIRREKVEEEFIRKDLKGESFISKEACKEILRSFCRSDKISADAIAKASTEFAVQHAKLKESETEEKASSKPWTLEMMQRLVQQCCIQAEIQTCAQEREIQQEFSIHRDTFRPMRFDLLLLKTVYKRFVGDTSRGLNVAECERLFQEFGIRGVLSMSQHVGDNGIEFVDLLGITEQIRRDLESDSFDDLRGSFEDFDKVCPHSRMLSITDVQDFLASVELMPCTQEEQTAVTRALEEVLATSAHEDDMVEFEQVQRVLQRMREANRRRLHCEEVQAALAHGFREDELEELRETFDILDADGSGTIEPDEAWNAIKTLGFRISKAHFSGAYRQVDNDGSGALQFIEFLKLLQLIRDREGCFSTNRHINTLSELLRAEIVHLLNLFHECLDGEAEHMEQEDLLHKVCACFGIAANENLHKRLNAKTVKELSTAASALFQERMKGG